MGDKEALERLELTPLELAALRDCVERGSTRTNDGGMTDTLLSILCSKPSLENPCVTWRINPNSRADGYISLYTPTALGRQALAALSNQGKPSS